MLAPLMDLMMAFSLAFSIVQQPLGTCDFTSMDLRQCFLRYGFFLGLDWLASAISFALEPVHEDWRLLLWLPVQRLLYRQTMYVIALRALAYAISGHPVGWGYHRRHATLAESLAQGPIDSRGDRVAVGS